MTTYRDRDEICRRMNRLRGRLDQGVKHWTADAERWLHWEHYVREFPWQSLAVVALAGFWLVPARRVKPVVKLDATSIEKIAQVGHGTPQPTRPGFLMTGVRAAISTVGAALLRNAVGHWAQHLASQVGQPSPRDYQEVS